MLMQKEKETGFLVKEVDTYHIDVEEELVERIYMIEEDGKEIVTLHLTTSKEVEDWQFSAIFDYYNEEIFNERVLSFEEVEDCYDPTWKFTFQFIEDHERMQEFLNEIVNIHKNELERVYEEIKDKKEEYLQ